ncbi:MAG: excalibur calcium-binding domain-containing protein [Thermomicrobiales bacterium]
MRQPVAPRPVAATLLLLVAVALALATVDPASASPADEAERNCAAFATQPEAQAWFVAHGGSVATNAGGLDADRDGIACEHLPGGAEASGEDSGFPWLWAGLGVAGVGMAGIGGAAVFTRSRRASTPVGTGARPVSATASLPDDIPCEPPPPGWPSVTPDRAHALAAMPEDAYRRTPDWTQRAEAILQATGSRCQLCGAGSSAGLMLPDQVRQRTPERHGNERPCDLIVLCDRCAGQLGLAPA